MLQIFHFNVGKCGPPVAGDGVVIHNYTTTFEALDHPSLSLARMANDTIIATCNSGGHWNTDPAT